jgi:hypothetical protein
MENPLRGEGSGLGYSERRYERSYCTGCLDAILVVYSYNITNIGSTDLIDHQTCLVWQGW